MDELFKELVAIPSVCGDLPVANKIIDLIEQKLSPYKLHVRRFEENGFPSLVATTQKTDKPTVMLYSHLDVVDAPKHLFKLRLEDGKYYGRGALDMKFAAATYLHILENLGHTLSQYNFGVMFTTDEESYGKFGTGKIVEEGYLPSVCLMPDSGFGPGWLIEKFAKGCWFAHVTALGVSAHGSRPWEGESASIKLAKTLSEISVLFDDRQKPDSATLNIGMIRSGMSINQIPAAAMATLDVRFAAANDYHELSRKIQGICDRHSVTLQTVREWNAPTTTDLSNPYIATFMRHVQTQTGRAPEPIVAYGTTDARFFAKKDVPCILLSPPGGKAHSNEEWLDAAGYEQFKLVVRAYLEEVARTYAPDLVFEPTDALTIRE
jgi:acetylornithine deacetylase/succinyl-diaminopimelate desuccinylase-like protein